MTGTEIYKRTPAYEREIASIRLHAPQWKLLLAFDGQRSLAEVALSVDVPFIDALPLTDKFLNNGWIEEQPITLDQYLKRTGATSASAIGSAIIPAVVLHEPKPEAAAPAAMLASAVMEEAAQSFQAASPTPPAVPKPPVAPTLSIPPPLIPPALSTAPATPPPLNPPPLSPRRGPMKIKAVVDHIISQVGNNSLGQLVVYRVFLRVPPQLLQAEDIASVHLVNDSSLVKTESLKEAIAQSVMEVLKRPLPDSVFA